MNVTLDNIIFALQRSGGISVYWSELIRRLLTDPGFTLSFIDLPNENIFRKNLSIPQQAIIRNPLASYPLSVQRYLNPGVRGRGIFHSSYYRSSSDLDMVNVTTVHDFTYEYYRKGLPRMIHGFQKGRTVRNSKKIICVSENTRADLLKFYPDIDPESITVIYNGVDDGYHPLERKEESELRKFMSFSSGEYALYVGDRKSVFKNFPVAVRACKTAGVPLVTAGGGTLTPAERELLKDNLGPSGNKALSYLSNEQLNLIYNHALCLLYPSSYEGFGIPIIEAQKAGCPVMTTRLSSIPEVAGKGAIFSEAADDIYFASLLSQIRANPSLTGTVIEEGLRNAHRFSWDTCYMKTKDVYREVNEKYCQA
ncbi:MAG TPA: glycosyltransferase family 1 protein [Bacteroidales bacterium]|nr:glycosyltransferase family 1 protein [Bacteroidales bacterium]